MFVAINTLFNGNQAGYIELSINNIILYSLIVMLSIIMFILFHEYLHGIGFRIDREVIKKDIKFGFSKKLMAPYCVCKKPNKITSTRISLMLPIFVICFPMFIAGLIIDNVGLLFFASFCLSGSSGDIYYLWKLRKEQKDHYMFEASVYNENLLGFHVFKKVD